MANIYFDMDGVLVDYFGGLKDTAKKLGVAEDDNKAIWDEINKNPIEWWTNLNPIPDGMKLFNAVKSKEPSILSSAGAKQETKQGKLAWLKKNGLSPYLKEIVFVNNKSAKKKYAQDGDILIDDRKDNVADWEMAGGKGYVFNNNSGQILQQLKSVKENYWKNYLNKKRLQENIIKEFPSPFFPTIKNFVDFVGNRLELKDVPKVHIINSPNFSQQYKSFGGYLPAQNKISVVVKGRGLADILRTIAHEMVHAHQKEANKLDITSGETGSPIENEANALAGVIMRDYGKENPMIFEL
jgi:phosphoglycolate phosphatase-like HAD superfamily hydrolase